MQDSIPIGREAFRLGNETGMFVEAAYALFNDCWFALLSGRDLDDCRQTCKANVEYTKRIKMRHFAVGAPQVILQWGLALQGLTEHPLSFTDANFNETAFQRDYHGQALFEMFYFDAKLAVLYTFENIAPPANLPSRRKESLKISAARFGTRSESIITALRSPRCMRRLLGKSSGRSRKISTLGVRVCKNGRKTRRTILRRNI
jgi:hypothetical protein